MPRVLVMVGTQKGAFFFWSDEERREWRVEGPLLKGWEVSHFVLDQRRGEPVLYAGLGHFVYGSTVHESHDLGKTWTQMENGPNYDADSGHKLNRVWSIAPGHPSEPDVLYAGVDEAGLFVSHDRGQHWQGVDSLNNHETREEWSPGAGGLCCHTILIDPQNKDRMWVGISAVGTFRTDDGGKSWNIKNEGIPLVVPSEKFDDVGCCVHRLVLTPEHPDLLYQQNHRGVFRSKDAGDHWERIEEGIPSSFGFPLVMHPGDSKTLYVIPQESDEYRFCLDGQLAVYRTRDGGDSWQRLSAGLPSSNCYVGVLRQAMAVDGLPQCGIYFGTTGGQLFYSTDDGDHWASMPATLPRIYGVTAVAVE